ncbi:MAG: hypothetical protein HRT47_11910 [Candidatus Caenarcaniphilales bacterium]|nr:hypothetical protein [Candidatus Caenarcaniphilales bacterium]
MKIPNPINILPFTNPNHYYAELIGKQNLATQELNPKVDDEEINHTQSLKENLLEIAKTSEIKTYKDGSFDLNIQLKKSEVSQGLKNILELLETNPYLETIEYPDSNNPNHKTVKTKTEKQVNEFSVHEKLKSNQIKLKFKAGSIKEIVDDKKEGSRPVKINLTSLEYA